jgi:hypothetical protein
MASKTEIANMALSHLGIGKEIANIDTEKSAEAAACRRFFNTCLSATLKDFPWPFASKIATLNLIEEEPNDEWAYSYQYPVDCIHAKRIVSGNANETRQERIDFKIANSSSSKIILTNKDLAELEYTANITDPNVFSPDFIIALSFRLAAYVAPRLTQGDPFKLKNDMLGQYAIEIGMARSNAMNEQQDSEVPSSELIRARE